MPCHAGGQCRSSSVMELLAHHRFGQGLKAGTRHAPNATSSGVDAHQLVGRPHGHLKSSKKCSTATLPTKDGASIWFFFFTRRQAMHHQFFFIQAPDRKISDDDGDNSVIKQNLTWFTFVLTLRIVCRGCCSQRSPRVQYCSLTVLDAWSLFQLRLMCDLFSTRGCWELMVVLVYLSFYFIHHN